MINVIEIQEHEENEALELESLLNEVFEGFDENEFEQNLFDILNE